MSPEINIINEDCMTAMSRMVDKQYQLAIVDPPYGIGMMDSDNKSRGKLAKAKDYKKIHDSDSPNVEYFQQLQRVSVNQVIFGANHFISKNPIDSSCWLVWDKDNGNNDFADCELAWTNFKTAVRRFKYRWNGMLQQDMKNKEHRIHPTQKPVALYQWILKNYAKPGDRILDTHGGSCSLAIACDIMGFDAVICEIDKDYYDAAVERFNRHKQQQVLDFGGCVDGKGCAQN
jgi:site-specific DNA-methyltransferase (adenine-specific)